MSAGRSVASQRIEIVVIVLITIEYLDDIVEVGVVQVRSGKDPWASPMVS